MIMEKKVYITPSLKATDMENEALLAGSPITDPNTQLKDPDPTTADPGDPQLGRKHFSVWDEDEE